MAWTRAIRQCRTHLECPPIHHNVVVGRDIGAIANARARRVDADRTIATIDRDRTHDPKGADV